jgi:hypothetical protein
LDIIFSKEALKALRDNAEEVPPHHIALLQEELFEIDSHTRRCFQSNEVGNGGGGCLKF